MTRQELKTLIETSLATDTTYTLGCTTEFGKAAKIYSGEAYPEIPDSAQGPVVSLVEITFVRGNMLKTDEAIIVLACFVTNSLKTESSNLVKYNGSTDLYKLMDYTENCLFRNLKFMNVESEETIYNHFPSFQGLMTIKYIFPRNMRKGY